MTTVPRLRACPDEYGGVGMFAGEDIDEGVVVTHYFGPIRFPSIDKATSKTHSVRILGDMSVPVDRRECRVIDGIWAKEALEKHLETQDKSGKVAVELTPFLGSMINSSRNTGSPANVMTDARVHDQQDSVFAYTFLSQSAVRTFLTDKQLQDEILGDKTRSWVKLAIVSTRRIAEGEELTWSYPYRHQI